MAGLRKIAKMYGGMKVNGIEYVWDYAADEPVQRAEMPMGSERWKLSEEVRWRQLSEAVSGMKASSENDPGF